MDCLLSIFKESSDGSLGQGLGQNSKQFQTTTSSSSAISKLKPTLNNKLSPRHIMAICGLSLNKRRQGKAHGIETHSRIKLHEAMNQALAGGKMTPPNERPADSAKAQHTLEAEGSSSGESVWPAASAMISFATIGLRFTQFFQGVNSEPQLALLMLRTHCKLRLCMAAYLLAQFPQDSL